MKKVVVIGIIILFLLTGFSSISGIQLNENIIIPSYKGNTLYVGGSGEGNYTKIQDAIDNASDGDTVFVYDDSSPYTEPEININKSINLIGEDRNTTVIANNSISIRKSGVNVSGFTFEGDILVDGTVSDIVISDNHIIDDGYCSMGFYADNSFIISNTITNSGIFLSSNSNKISNNIFINTLLDYYYSEFNIFCNGGGNHVISNNTFINYYEKDNYLKGIKFNFIKDCIIEYNEFTGYKWDAIFMQYSSRNNLISHNTFINNSCGVAIFDNSGFNRVINNTFINNSCGVSVGYFSCFNKIINNNFINNNVDAYVLHFTLSFFNIFDGNFWDEWVGLKFPILSFLPHISYDIFYSIPCGFVFDWNPAKEPYNYTTTQGCGII